MEPALQTNISEYAVSRVRSGASKSVIKEELLSVGWAEDEVERAYAQALVSCGVPAPQKGEYVSSKKGSTVEVIINIFSFVLLGIIVTAVLSLFFGIIENAFPDALTDRYTYTSVSESIHYATAALIIGFPLYYAVMRLWFKRFRDSEEKTESRLTQWITYLVLLFSAIAMVGDCIATIFTFLQGEITVRFFLKAITVLGVSGTIFGFYVLERKKIQYKKDIPRNIFQIFGGSVSGIIAIGIILGFIAVGSPETARQMEFDNQRSEDLQALESCIQAYTEKYKRLPENLQAIKKSSDFTYCTRFSDPETKDPYIYSIVSPLQEKAKTLEGEFELCASFSFNTMQTTREIDALMNANKWQAHTKGKYCLTSSAVTEKK